MGLLNAPVMLAFMNSVPQKRIGVASSMNNILMQVGASMGIAFFTAVLSNRAVYHIAMTGQDVKAGNPVFMNSFSAILQHIHSLGYNYAASIAGARGMLMGNIMQSAVIKAYEDTFIVAALVVFVSLPLAFMLPMQVVRQPHGEKPQHVAVE
jgi:hypothetical protein